MSQTAKAIRAACHAHTNLDTFATIVSILEGGHVYGSASNAAAARIIGICQREQQRCLADYDEARAVLEVGPAIAATLEAAIAGNHVPRTVSTPLRSPPPAPRKK